jgi:hypothetical protein
VQISREKKIRYEFLKENKLRSLLVLELQMTNHLRILDLTVMRYGTDVSDSSFGDDRKSGKRRNTSIASKPRFFYSFSFVGLSELGNVAT